MVLFFFFNDTATTEIYTLSLHDALPISRVLRDDGRSHPDGGSDEPVARDEDEADHHAGRGGDGRGDHGVVLVPGHGEHRSESTRLNSSHANISYAVFCLKKKKIHINRSL